MQTGFSRRDSRGTGGRRGDLGGDRRAGDLDPTRVRKMAGEPGPTL